MAEEHPQRHSGTVSSVDSTLYAPALRIPRPQAAPPLRASRPSRIWILTGALLLATSLALAYRQHPQAAPPTSVPRPIAPRAADPPVKISSLPEAEPPAPVPLQSASTAPRTSLLQVIQRSPTSQTFNYPDTVIEVTFSHPVNPESVPSAFRVTPAMEGTLEFPAPDRMVFRPRQLWDRGATYLVTLDEGIRDRTGLDQLDQTQWEFAIVGGYFYSRDIRPLVRAYCAPCHRSGGTAARVPLDDFPSVRRFVSPGNFDQSRFLTVLNDPNHQGKLAPQLIAKLFIFREWITVFAAGD